MEDVEDRNTPTKSELTGNYSRSRRGNYENSGRRRESHSNHEINGTRNTRKISSSEFRDDRSRYQQYNRADRNDTASSKHRRCSDSKYDSYGKSPKKIKTDIIAYDTQGTNWKVDYLNTSTGNMSDNEVKSPNTPFTGRFYTVHKGNRGRAGTSTNNVTHRSNETKSRTFSNSSRFRHSSHDDRGDFDEATSNMTDKSSEIKSPTSSYSGRMQHARYKHNTDNFHDMNSKVKSPTSPHSEKFQYSSYKSNRSNSNGPTSNMFDKNSEIKSPTTLYSDKLEYPSYKSNRDNFGEAMHNSRYKRSEVKSPTFSFSGRMQSSYYKPNRDHYDEATDNMRDKSREIKSPTSSYSGRMQDSRYRPARHSFHGPMSNISDKNSEVKSSTSSYSDANRDYFNGPTNNDKSSEAKSPPFTCLRRCQPPTSDMRDQSHATKSTSSTYADRVKDPTYKSYIAPKSDMCDKSNEIKSPTTLLYSRVGQNSSHKPSGDRSSEIKSPTSPYLESSQNLAFKFGRNSLNTSISNMSDGSFDAKSPNSSFSGRLPNAYFRSSTGSNQSPNSSFRSRDSLPRIKPIEDYYDDRRYLDKDFCDFLDYFKPFIHSDSYRFKYIKEIEADLFEMDGYALGHCVAEDMRMGSGIAVQFRKRFMEIPLLLNQFAQVGEIAVLKQDARYIYYLVTKHRSEGKPTYETLFKSLIKMKEHILQHRVKKLALPRIGCGLDRLRWYNVKQMLEYIFADTEIKVLVCNFTQDFPDYNDNQCPLYRYSAKITELNDRAIIVCLGSADGAITDDMVVINEKWDFVGDYQQGYRQVSENIVKEFHKHTVYCCIVKETTHDVINFMHFDYCLKDINKHNKNDKYEIVALQYRKTKENDLMLEKILNVMRNTLRNVEILLYEGY